MPKYVIEREIPNVGKSTPEQLKAISQASCTVLDRIGNGIEWIESYVTNNKIYCVYNADNKELIEEHAKQGGFPANKIEEVFSVISPKTAEEPVSA